MARIQSIGAEILAGLIARFEDLVVGALRRVASAAARLLGATPDRVDPQAVSVADLGAIRVQWLDGLDAQILPELGTVYAQGAAATAADLVEVGREVAALTAPDAAEFLAAARNRLVGVGDHLWESARDQLVMGMHAGEDMDALAARVASAADVSEARARVIARTEVISAMNAASLAQVRVLGDPTVVKEWLATPGPTGTGCDTRTRPSHCAADGQRVRVGERFEVGDAHLDFPGDPTGPPEEVISERCSMAFDLDDEPVVASADGQRDMEGQTMAQPDGPPLVAPEPDPTAAPEDEQQADEPTGAMIALIPSDTDLQRLVVDGGESPEQLHCTLMYLGEAADIPEPTREALIAQIQEALTGWPIVDADGFAVSLFNPGDANDRPPCVVLGLSGEDLDVVHDLVADVVTEVGDAHDETPEDDVEQVTWEPPEQHTPYQPHITLIYTEDAGQVGVLTDRVGPVVFDRVRLAFAGEVTDIPLAAESAIPDDDPDEAGLTAAAGAVFQSRMPEQLRRHWLKELAPWGKGSFRRCVRRLRKYFPQDPEGTCSSLHHEATGRWPGSKKNSSIAAGSEETTMADAPTEPAPEPVPAPTDCPDGQHLDPDSGECVPDEEQSQMAARPEHFHAIMHVEGVSTGMRMFEPGSLEWRDTPFAFHWQRGSSAHNGTPETVQVGNVTRVERDGNAIHGWGRLDLGSMEGAEYGRKLAEGFARWVSIGLDESLKEADIEYVWPEGSDDEDAGLELLFAEPEEMIFHKGRIAELTAVSIPAQAEASIEPTQALIDELTAMGLFAAEQEPSRTSEGPIVAAGYTVTIPDLPSANWFAEPTDMSPHGELRVDEQGRLWGYLAPANVSHRSFPGKRVRVPMGNVDYSGWMNKPWPVAEGHKIYVGVITMECGHASINPGDPSYTRRREHYDNSCSIAAHARIGENRHGVWVAGALAPWITAEYLGKLMSCQLSGDWQFHPDKPGWRDFVAALTVPAPGLPNRVPPATVRVAEGVLVASAVPVRFVHADDAQSTPDLRPALERLARGIGRDAATRMQMLRNRVHTGGR